MTSTTITPRRIVALLLTAVAIVGLAFMRAGRDPDHVSVPANARAGQLTLDPCTYEAEHATLEADCGKLVVPENRADPKSRLIAIPVTRIRAQSPSAKEPIFRFEGGPGKTNMTFPQADRFAKEHDVVLVGYRGVDGSARLDCPEVSAAMKKPRDLLGAAARREIGKGFRDCAKRLTGEGFDLAGYTLQERVADFDDARKALGYDKIDMISESAGTRTAIAYASDHPEAVDRSVLVAVNPPGHFLWNGAVTDGLIGRYSQLCEQADCDAGDLAATMRRVSNDMPGRWMGLPIHSGNVRIASFFGFMESTSAAAPLNAPMTIDAWAAAGRGDASGFWAGSLMANLFFPEGQVWGDVAAIGRADLSSGREYLATGGGGKDSILRNAATQFLFGGGDLFDNWPAGPGDDAYSDIAPMDTETLLVTGELDGATPVGNQETIMPSLRNGRSVVVEELGHTISFWAHQPRASTRLITTYLDSGRVDESAYVPTKVEFDPGFTQTMLGKIIAGTFVGLPILCALALAGIARRTRRRGKLRTRSSAAVRTAFAAVCGLAGWMFAVIAVLATSAPVAIDDPTLAMVAVAIPVAAAVHFGWLDHGRSRRMRTIGFAAAAAGAIIGARLGYGVAADFAALWTAIAGSVVGANLAVIARDMWAGDDPVAPPPARTRETAPDPRVLVAS